MDPDGTFSPSEVVAMGFEATCVGTDRALYFWHQRFGVRIEERSGRATLLTDPSVLPDVPWRLTSLGKRELKLAASRKVEQGSIDAA